MRSLILCTFMASLAFGEKCEIWSKFTTKDEILTHGIKAGDFKENFHSFIGRLGLQAGRIEISPSSLNFYLTSGGKVAKTSSNFEFLRKNDNFTYNWIEGRSQKCLADAVTVNGKFMFGRKNVSDFSRLGKVRIGYPGLYHDDPQGREVLSDNYEVLTCKAEPLREIIESEMWKNAELEKNNDNLEKSVRNCEGNLQKCEKIRKKLENLEKNLTAENQNLLQGKEILFLAAKNCTKSLEKMLKKVITEKKSMKTEIESLQNQLNLLKTQNKEQSEKILDIEPKLNECEDTVELLEEEKKKYENQLSNIRVSHAEQLENLRNENLQTLDKQKNNFEQKLQKLTSENENLHTENENLRAQIAAITRDANSKEILDENSISCENIENDIKAFNSYVIDMMKFMKLLKKPEYLKNFQNSPLFLKNLDKFPNLVDDSDISATKIAEKFQLSLLPKIFYELNKIFTHTLEINCDMIPIDQFTYTCAVDSWTSRFLNTKIEEFQPKMANNIDDEQFNDDENPQNPMEATFVTEIVFRSQICWFLPKNLAEFFPNLIKLTITESKVQKIRGDELKGLKKLENLDLSDNQISSINEEAFNELVSLKTLNLDANEIVKIKSDIFATNLVLESVSIANNRLRTFNEKLIQKLMKIKEVNLKNNACVDLIKNDEYQFESSDFDMCEISMD